MRPLSTWLGLIGWIIVCFVPSMVGVFFLPGTWYESLTKPAWTPPNWVFGPVWTMLYLLMAIAAWRVWKQHGIARRSELLTGPRFALSLFLVHLVFNAAWSILFFGMNQITLAAIEITILWAMILILVFLFLRLDRIAGMLLVPYLLWVTYATTLNLGFAVLN